MPRVHIRSCMIAMSIVCSLLGQALEAGVILDLRADKHHYLIDEPIFLTVTLKNTGSSLATVLRQMHPGVGLLALEITSPGEPSRQYGPSVHFDYTREGLLQGTIGLGPGESYAASVDLTYDSASKPRGVLLQHPGEYVIRGTYSIPDDLPLDPVLPAHSNEVRILVSQPAGVDSEAYSILRNGYATKQPWSASSDQIQHYERLLRECPNSGYAIYARFYLAQAYELSGMMRPLRGTPAGREALEKAAGLYLNVADQAEGTALGVYNTRLGGNSLAKVGRDAEAQAVLERAFVSPSATDEDRLETLSWLGHLETGLFGESSGLADPKRKSAGKVEVPLRGFAEALGFSVRWNEQAKTVSVENASMHRLLCLKNSGNGAQTEGEIRQGHVQVRPFVIASLMAEHRGQGVANALSTLLAQVPQDHKH